MKAIIINFKKYLYALIMVAIAMVWMTINIIQGRQAKYDLEKEGKYTIGIIKKIEGAKSGRWVTVEFEFNGRKYTSESENESIPLSWIGEKVFIKFLPSRPVEFVFYDKVIIPDSLLNQAPMIWDSLPGKYKE